LSRDHKILVKAYVTYVRPILEYCSAVWSPHRIDLINKLEDVQRRFTKKLNGLVNLSYDKRLNFRARRSSVSAGLQYCSRTQLHETC